jgi:hypothetical protein
MGEAASNPRSSQYRGPLPENVIVPEIEAGTVIDPEWLKENKPAFGEEWPAPPDTAIHLQFYLVANWIRPSQLVPREKWPHQKVGVTLLSTMTMAEFKELAAAQQASKEGAQQGQGS